MHILRRGTLHLANWFDPNPFPRSTECDRDVHPDEQECTALSLGAHLQTRVRRYESLGAVWARCLSSTIDRRAAFERQLLLNAPFENMAMCICEADSITRKRARNVIPAKPGTMIEDGGVWNTFNDTLGL